ncbi:pentapeptide repeat-containing protein [Alistipes shahii]|uniref:pentapeptide repeat-containing protein n=1 Tax=Alistipes shahii TaxID=328814 RepID=UPI003A881968
MNKEIKISIKNRWTGSILFEYSSVDNTLAKTVLEALKGGANLRGANLRGADLRGANLYGANLRGADLYGADLYGANLHEADLYEADLYEADLYGANLRGANLRGANLREADLYEANLYGANLRGADLYGADLYGANLYGANLHEADLYGANLYGANLHGANLRGANLRGANLREAKGTYMACPTDGSFIGWKKASGYIVKLQITEDARRSSAGGEKCRCDKAYVVEIQNIDGTKADIETVHSNHDANFVYTVGATVEVSDFDGDRWNECAPGIHFFIDRRAAVEY